MQTTLNIDSLSFRETKTYILAALFVVGNILFPQLCHLVPQGGLIFLPIYFFTLIGAFLYGWRVGLITALLSPLVNSLFFGMPAAALLPVILFKSVTLAFVASLAARKFNSASLLVLAGVVVSYQAIGMAGEWLYTGSFAMACQDVRIGYPGMLLQIVGGWLLISRLARKG